MAQSFTPISLIAGLFVPASIQVLYTVPLLTSVQIEALTVTNTDTAPHAVSVYIAPNSAVAGGQYTVLPGQVLAPGQSIQVYQAINKVMNASGTIQAQCDTPGVVGIQASGLSIV